MKKSPTICRRAFFLGDLGIGDALSAKRGCKRKALCVASGRDWYIHATRDPLVAECRDAAYDETDRRGVLTKKQRQRLKFLVRHRSPSLCLQRLSKQH